jgi:hypothetical protein
VPSNPHEYDDDAYVDAVDDLQDAVFALWEAGAGEDDIKNEFENALRNTLAG